MKKLIIGLIILSLILIGCSSQRGTQVRLMGEPEYCFKDLFLEPCEGKPINETMLYCERREN